MTVNLNSAGQVKLVIWGADGTVLVSEGVEARSWTGPLPATQDYTIRVRNLGAAAADYSLTVTIPPLVGPTPTLQRITFPAGGISATVNGQVAAGGSGRWVIGARANQRMTASLAMRAGQAILVIWGADGTVLQSDHVGAGYFEGPLPKTQDYFIDVKCSAAAACNYALTVTIPPLR
jgi:serine/threonine-protein kinase